MLLSVIIPTCDRPERLRSLLRDIAATTSDHDDFEVIVVVDGGSAEPLADRTVLPDSIRFRGLNQDHAGPAAARNRAIELAEGRWLLFLDDDVRVDPNTIPRHLHRVRRDPDARVAYLGRADWPPRRLDSPWSILLAETSMVFFWNRMRHGRRYGFRHFWTLNLSVRRDLVRSVGGFHEGFPAAMHEDVELGWRLQRRFDLVIEVDESIRSLHDHPLTPWQYLRREHESGRSARRAREINREFHDEVWPGIVDPESQRQTLRALLLPAARRTLAIMNEWTSPGDRRPRPHEIEALYLAHLPMKRMTFLTGYVDRPFDDVESELGVVERDSGGVCEPANGLSARAPGVAG